MQEVKKEQEAKREVAKWKRKRRRQNEVYFVLFFVLFSIFLFFNFFLFFFLFLSIFFFSIFITQIINLIRFKVFGSRCTDYKNKLNLRKLLNSHNRILRFKNLQIYALHDLCASIFLYAGVWQLILNESTSAVVFFFKPARM